MKRQFKHLLIVTTISLFTLLTFGCDAFLEAMLTTEYVTYTNVKGDVVNAMSSGTSEEYWKNGTETLEGATLKFYPIESDGTYSTSSASSTTVESDGTFYAPSVQMGKCKVVGEKSGWVFVPRYVDISGEDMKIPPVIAYPDQGAGTIVIVLSWENTTLDLDGVLGNTDNSYVGFDNGSYHPTDNSGNIKLERDVTKDTASTIPRVETIIIQPEASTAYSGQTLNYYVHSYLSTDNSANGLLTGVDAESTDDAEHPIPFSESQVDIMYGSEHYGGWSTPWNTQETTLQIIKITCDGAKGSFTIASANNETPMRTVGE